jgi:O-antigen/teichoic acid export membrane protein
MNSMSIAQNSRELPKPPRTAAAHFAGTIFARLMLYPTTLISGVITARLLGPANRGIFQFLLVLGLLAFPFLSLGWGSATTYMLSSRRYAGRDVIASCMFVGFMLGLFFALVFFVLWQYDCLGNTAALTPSYAIIAVLVAMPLMGVNFLGTRVLAGLSLFHVLNRVVLLRPMFLTAVLLFTVAALQLGLTGAVIASTALVPFMTWLIYARIIRDVRPRMVINWTFIYEGTRFGLRSWLGDVSNQTSLRFDQTLLGWIGTAETLGVYSVGVAAGELLWVLPASLSLVLFNRIAGSSNPDMAGNLTARVHRLVIACSLVGMLLLGLLSGPLISILFGEAYSAAQLPLLILLPGSLAMCSFKTLVNFLTVQNRAGQASLAVALGQITSLILYFVLIPEYGMLGAACACTIGYTLTGLLVIIMFSHVANSRLHYLFLPTAQDWQWLSSQLALIYRGRISTTSASEE